MREFVYTLSNKINKLDNYSSKKIQVDGFGVFVYELYSTGHSFKDDITVQPKEITDAKREYFLNITLKPWNEHSDYTTITLSEAEYHVLREACDKYKERFAKYHEDAFIKTIMGTD